MLRLVGLGCLVTASCRRQVPAPAKDAVAQRDPAPCLVSSWDELDDVELTILPPAGLIWIFEIGSGACTLPGDQAEKLHVLDHLHELPGMTDDDIARARQMLASPSSDHVVIWRRPGR